MGATRQGKKYGFVPEALWGKFPNSWVLMLEKSNPIAFETTMILLSFLIHYATFFAPPNYTSNWALLITAGLGPTAFVIWHVAFPFNPYRSMAAIREGMKDLDQSDQNAKKLVDLLNSPVAHRFLFKQARKLSLLLVTPMIVISIAMRRMPIWRLSPDCVVGIPMFFFMCLFLLFRIEILAWALKNWKSFSGEDRISR